jgi:hypothetical protein
MQNIIWRVILVFTIARDPEILDRAAGTQPDALGARQNPWAIPVPCRQLSSGCVEMVQLFC